MTIKEDNVGHRSEAFLRNFVRLKDRIDELNKEITEAESLSKVPTTMSVRVKVRAYDRHLGKIRVSSTDRFPTYEAIQSKSDSKTEAQRVLMKSYKKAEQDNIMSKTEDASVRHS